VIGDRPVPADACGIPQMKNGAKPDAAALLERARRAIAARELPRGVSSRVWGGRGSGQPCSLCSQPIGLNDVEIELEGVEAAAGVRFHSKCHLLWLEACTSDGEDH
jgi:hypothetical protein